MHKMGDKYRLLQNETHPHSTDAGFRSRWSISLLVTAGQLELCPG